MKNEFEQFLLHSLDDCNDGKVKEAALYSLMNGGKRVRPLLVFATLNAYRTPVKKGLKAATAIEMMHCYSLIHDDLPAIDNDTLRRGKPTCHIAFGEDIAIIAGDALLTHSFLYAANATQEMAINMKIVNELANGGGLNGMLYGQELDMINENRDDLTLHELEKTHYHKTGKLLTMPFVMAAYIAKKDEDVETWREIGNTLGLLFQIQDDVFDVTKSSEQLGKNAMSDVQNNKVTYVTLLGIERCNALIKELYEKATSLLDTMVIEKEPLLEMFDYLLNRNY